MRVTENGDGRDDWRGGEAPVSGEEGLDVDLSGRDIRNLNLNGTRVREAMLAGARLSGFIGDLVINDVEVAPLIAAELDRRHPERLLLRPRTADGVREAWQVIEEQWAATKARASGLPVDVLRQRVDDEWSFLETQRHLVFVHDAWIGARALGRSGHFCRFALPPSFIADPSPNGIDRAADPSIDEVVAAREERMAETRSLVDGLADADLPVERAGFTVLRCIRTVLDEEWAHNRYANRDLDRLDVT